MFSLLLLRRHAGRRAGHLQDDAARQASHDVLRDAVQGDPPRLQEVHVRRESPTARSGSCGPAGLHSCPDSCQSDTPSSGSVPRLPAAAAAAVRALLQRRGGTQRRRCCGNGNAARQLRTGIACLAARRQRRRLLASLVQLSPAQHRKRGSSDRCLPKLFVVVLPASAPEARGGAAEEALPL